MVLHAHREFLSIAHVDIDAALAGKNAELAFFTIVAVGCIPIA